MISAIINTKNSQETLTRALESVRFADEIVVIDAGSTDKTIEIAQKYTNHIILSPSSDFVEPIRNFAVSKASYEWILLLDADEAAPADLIHELSKLTQMDVDVWEIPRKNMILGKWMRHTGWWPDYHRRFFKKGKLTWDEKIHSIPKTKGKVGSLPAEEKLALRHENIVTVKDYIDRLNHYTSIEAKQNISDSNAKDAYQSFFDDFLRRYFAQQGYLDYQHGAYLSLVQSFYQFLTSMKQWEKHGKSNRQVELEPVLRRFSRDLKYWLADKHINESHNFLEKWYWQVRRKLKL